MKISKAKRNNIIFLVIIGLLVIPQTCQPIQIVFHKLWSHINSAQVIEASDRRSINNYNWQLIDESNSIYDFNEAKEKVIVINFWATWCPPCIAEMGSLQHLYEKYKDEVVFLFVTNDEFEVVQKFKTKNNYTFPVVRPYTKSSGLFQVRSIPRTFVINKKGEVVIDKSGAVNWFSEAFQSEIKTLISE